MVKKKKETEKKCVYFLVSVFMNAIYKIKNYKNSASKIWHQNL
jgi:hypothetical protein